MQTLNKFIQGNELYIYNAAGNLIYKRWLKTGASKMFHSMEGVAERCVENKRKAEA